jgi:PAS domain S-box-containing protein
MDNKSPPAAFGAAPILPFVAGALAVAIFAIDTLVPLDSAIAALYAIVVLLAANYFQERGVILWVSAGCLALTVLSFLAQHSLTADAALVRCLVSLLAIGATTFLALENTRLYRNLAEREAKIRSLVDSNLIGIFIWNIDGQIIEANDAFLQMVGYDREDLASGRVNRTDMTPMEWRERDARTVAEAKATGTVQPFEKEYFRKDGSCIPVLIGVTAFDDKRDQGVGFVLDLTERKRASETLREMQMALTHTTRIATMGQLTASIAHEVSQPISATIIYARAGLRWLAAAPPDLDEVRQALKGIVQEGERAGDVLGRIRGLVKKGPTRKDVIAINDVIVDVIALTRSELLSRRVSLQTDLATDFPRIEGDRVQLQQVILNLILNAVEAMGDNNEAARELWISSKMDGENRVLVAVRDTGSGLDPNRVDRLFEPFYTTKAEGMGIGLSLSRTIIEAHGGRLWAGANEPRGAIFQFTVPAHADSAS